MERKRIFCCVVTGVSFILVSIIFSFFCRKWLLVGMFSVPPAIFGTMGGLKGLEVFLANQKEAYSRREMLEKCPLICDVAMWNGTMQLCCIYSIVAGGLISMIVQLEFGVCILAYVIVQLVCWMIGYLLFKN